MLAPVAVAERAAAVAPVQPGFSGVTGPRWLPAASALVLAVLVAWRGWVIINAARSMIRPAPGWWWPAGG